MLKLDQSQYDLFAAQAPSLFQRRVADYIAEDFPEAVGAGPERDTAQRLAGTLTAQAQSFGLDTQEQILRFVELRLGYFDHAPLAYRWAFDLLNDPALTGTEKMLELKDRILGISRWA